MRKKKVCQCTGYGVFITRPHEVRARKLLDNETVKCYNGLKIGLKGDFVVVDEQDRVMVMRPDKFMRAYKEKTA
jgi:hypothetical protein